MHRLDRPVSGVLLFARTSKAAARLAEQFREGTVEKIYWAVVEGEVERTGRHPGGLADQGPRGRAASRSLSRTPPRRPAGPAALSSDGPSTAA